YGIKKLRFHSDIFTLKWDYTIKLCKRMIEEDLDYLWFCFAHVNHLDREQLEWMKRAGCERILVGFESGSQKILDYINKGISVDRSLKIGRMIKDFGINFTGDFMVNFPGENYEDLMKTDKLIQKMPMDLSCISLLLPFPGTDIFEVAKERGYENPFDWSDWDRHKNFYHFSEVPVKELKRLKKLMTVKSFFYNKNFYLYLLKSLGKRITSLRFNILNDLKAITVYFV
ncbi:MAG: radical SAM protein, partial [Candidatus Aenigmatarchaeota archaeon]